MNASETRLSVEQIMKMRREAESQWPLLGRMSCGELADVAVTATAAVLTLTAEAVCTDWYDMPNTARMEALEARLEAAERVVVNARQLTNSIHPRSEDEYFEAYYALKREVVAYYSSTPAAESEAGE